jgi:isopenicillin-N epimerase
MELVCFSLSVAAVTAVLSRRRRAAQVATCPLSPYGLAVRKLFPTDFSFVHLNHGSYGVAPLAVMAEAREVMLRIEAFPDNFFRRTGLPAYRGACDAAADFLGAPRGSLVLVENATVGVNAVLRSQAFARGDAIVINDNTYNACKNAVNDRAANTGAVVSVFALPLELPSDKAAAEALLVAAFVAALDATPTAKLALLDHITSPTGLVMPIRACVEAAHARGVRVLVDGAHAPGMLDLRIAESGADWYTGNMHKWCYSLKGVAVLYASPAVVDETQGSAISHFWRRDFSSRFFMQGTMDYSRYISLPFALGWVERELGGWPAVRVYNSGLVSAGADVLCAAWGTTRLLPPALCAPFLVVVETPLDWRVWGRTGGGNLVGLPLEEAEAALAADEGFNERIAGAIFESERMQTVFFSWRVGGRMRVFTRISGQVYNVIGEYEQFAAAVLALPK